jgi:dTMP kinase
MKVDTKNNRKAKGKFIVIEGGEGSGKTTLVAMVRELFPHVVVSREPGGAPFAEKIRSVILSPDAKEADANTQFGLFWAARADHMKNTVIPAITSGKIVLLDRFDSSSYAYQIHGQENKHLRKLFFEVRKIYLGKHVPHLYIFLDVKPEIGMQRRASQKGYDVNHFDERDVVFHTRIRKGYLEFLKYVPHKIIDAHQPLEKVKEDFKKIIEKFLK